MRRVLLALSLCFLAAPAFAQNQAAKSAACDARSVPPPTPPTVGPRDGTAPGNSGSTGWSGGTGGSFIGTDSAGVLPNSPTWQPRTARGLDPMAQPVRTASAC